MTLPRQRKGQATQRGGSGRLAPELSGSRLGRRKATSVLLLWHLVVSCHDYQQFDARRTYSVLGIYPLAFGDRNQFSVEPIDLRLIRFADRTIVQLIWFA